MIEDWDFTITSGLRILLKGYLMGYSGKKSCTSWFILYTIALPWFTMFHSYLLVPDFFHLQYVINYFEFGMYLWLRLSFGCLLSLADPMLSSAWLLVIFETMGNQSWWGDPNFEKHQKVAFSEKIERTPNKSCWSSECSPCFGGDTLVSAPWLENTPCIYDFPNYKPPFRGSSHWHVCLLKGIGSNVGKTMP